MKTKLRRLLIPGVILACAVLMMSLKYEAPSEAEMLVMKYAKEKQVAFTEYPESLLKLLEDNPETKEFVLDYPFRESWAVDLSRYDGDRGVPLFLQWDRQWGYEMCHGEFVGVNGSAAMCLAMAGYCISDGSSQFSPDKIIKFAEKNDYRDAALICQGGAALGLKVTSIAWEKAKVTAYLKNGDPIIASMGPGGDFDNFVVLTGYREGMVSLRDPDSRINSEKQWAFEELAGQMRNLWVIQSNN